MQESPGAAEVSPTSTEAADGVQGPLSALSGAAAAATDGEGITAQDEEAEEEAARAVEVYEERGMRE